MSDNIDTRRRWMARAALGLGVLLAHSRTATAQAPSPAPAAGKKKTVGVVLYPDFEVLDVFGPVEMWANTPDLKVIFVAQTAGPVRSAQGVSVVADHDFASAPPLDIVMTPGGVGTFAQLRNETFLQYLRDADRGAEFTTSVCTGSALLARAGLLKGRRATSNKKFFALAEQQGGGVTWVRHARWVEDGKYITSSGVSAGTDMALGVVARLHGKEAARTLARLLEYQWSEDPNNDPFAIG
ncbi:MAG: DJ-1/PfpI family protein [Phenylobacterium sp.]|uniref:DJ-1/PfpI family protein n=1 Tax=Phenylobacterium sp. TaxID=1871053 RepID=UPI001A55115B|nr:DJ-1/PfpI family protein [Phenylobacterium sp.]MBL8554358.1 DJ-1/PfpI family protein [Phenylobacterium sp.]